jgi:hypothetical protein
MQITPNLSMSAAQPAMHTDNDGLGVSPDWTAVRGHWLLFIVIIYQ